MALLKDILQAVKATAAKEFGTCEPDDVIEWRLEVCRVCPMRRRARSALERASVVLGTHGVSGQVCDVCGCSLPLLASAKPEHMHEDSPEEAKKRPKSCWMNS